MIGTVLKHRYEVLEKIGEGSFFTVYKCQDKIDNRTVAVKVLLPQYAANGMFAERMIVEAQAMIGVRHPGIVEVLDTGCQDGNYFIVVEYVKGVDLRERLRRSTPLTLLTAIDLGMALCDALDYAHRRGFVHGDLRPGNILVTAEGQIKIADFWVNEAVVSSQSIRTNAMMRSIHYMAPEVAEGKQSSTASDIYSLGIILFEALTGTLPFEGDTPITVALKHAKEPVPSPRTLNPGIPKTLDAVIVKALQKLPHQRFRSAKAMFNDLKAVRNALNLTKTVTWTAVSEKETPEPPSEEAEDELEEIPILSAILKTLIVIVALIGIFGVMVIGYVWMSPGEVEVPDLIGQQIDRARIIADQKHITLNIKGEEYNENTEKFPKGTIYFMNPAPGRHIKEGKSVDVWVSKGSKYTKTPSIVNLTMEDAREQIINAGLTVGEISQDYNDTIPAGSVISQSPAPGTRQERGQRVNMVVSLGPKFEEEIPTPPEEENRPPMEPRSFDVIIKKVPPGRDNQTVQIVVVDNLGEKVAYTGLAKPGDRIQQTVEGIGERIVIRVYIDGKLVQEETK
ncbi:MAG: protein kinase [Armatimonadetes bacterium]|nr:protein kinase [Armatimonadota bacterium]